MKKYRKFFAVVLTMVLILSGCSSAKAPQQEPEPSLQPQLTGPLTLGDRMPELTITTAEGESLTLSRLLEQKKMVLLNFWYADCIWCVREFPVMEVSYQSHNQAVEILALNPYDSAETITAFQKEHSLSFPMAGCSRDLTGAFGINGYPTSVVVDREGTICLIHAGAITDVRVFNRLFETFTAENYTQKLYHSINDLL
jgi:peroxiredoxin